MAIPSSGRMVVRPPDKGSFPLDHDGECRKFMVKYMICLKNNEYENTRCREESKAYLNCRMEKDLMTKEDWSKLGYANAESNVNVKSDKEKT